MKKLFLLVQIVIVVSNGLTAQISIKKEKGGVWVLDGDRKIGFYQKDNAALTPKHYWSNYWNPLNLPDGSAITDFRPASHLLHRGLFLAWHQVIIGNRSVGNLWGLENIKVNVKKVKFKKIDQTKGQFETLAFWQSTLWEKGKSFLEESTRYVFHAQKENYNVIKMEISLKALTDSVYIGGSTDSKGYGGLSLRMKLPADLKFFSSGGEVTPLNDYQVEAGSYMNIFGTLTDDNKQGGILFYVVPDNHKSPQPWILRNRAMSSMQNPVFPGRTPTLIPKGKPIILTYYLVLYTGSIDPDSIIKAYGF